MDSSSPRQTGAAFLDRRASPFRDTPSPIPNSEKRCFFSCIQGSVESQSNLNGEVRRRPGGSGALLPGLEPGLAELVKVRKTGKACNFHQPRSLRENRAGGPHATRRRKPPAPRCLSGRDRVRRVRSPWETMPDRQFRQASQRAASAAGLLWAEPLRPGCASGPCSKENR
jgi:hypothetical protein